MSFAGRSILTAALLTVFEAASAGPLEDGKAAFDHGDYEAALRLLMPLAEQGDATAQDTVGLAYENNGVAETWRRDVDNDDQVVQQNYLEAAKWFRMAAVQGLASAQFHLGRYYNHPGKQNLQNLPEALRWYRKAADQGYAKAQDELGGWYSVGFGVSLDYSEAEKWYTKAADQGDTDAQDDLAELYDIYLEDYGKAAIWYRKIADRGEVFAQYRLGRMYLQGRGVPQDYALAHMWFNLASRNGYLDAITARDELAAKMPPDQIAEAQRLARDWKPTK
jgi:TPR repeat protein